MLALNITQAKELQEIERYKSQGYNAKAEPTGQLAAIMKESGSKPSYTRIEFVPSCRQMRGEKKGNDDLLRLLAQGAH